MCGERFKSSQEIEVHQENSTIDQFEIPLLGSTSKDIEVDQNHEEEQANMNLVISRK